MVVDDRRMLLLSILYQLVHCLLGLTVVLARRDLSKDVPVPHRSGADSRGTRTRPRLAIRTAVDRQLIREWAAAMPPGTSCHAA